MNESYITQGGVGAIKVKDEIIFIFLYMSSFSFMKEWMENNINTQGENSRSSIFKKLTSYERKNSNVINLFSLEHSKTNIKHLDKETLNWITYSFIQHYNPKYNIKGMIKEYEITDQESTKGEKAVEGWLQKNNILYDKEYSYPDLKGEYKFLRFDFKIKDKNIVIEFQGQQHYMPVEKFGGEATFNKTIKYDNLKRIYCGKNKIHLIEIPYNLY